MTETEKRLAELKEEIPKQVMWIEKLTAKVKLAEQNLTVSLHSGDVYNLVKYVAAMKDVRLRHQEALEKLMELTEQARSLYMEEASIKRAYLEAR